MGRILVVDDEELVRETLCHMLEDAGYEVFEPGEGSEFGCHFRRAPCCHRPLAFGVMKLQYFCL